MKTTNFEFIQRRWPNIYDAAVEAEQQVFTKAITSGMYCRQAMELLLNWVYDIDVEYELPYQNTIAAKLRADCFQNDVPRDIIRELEAIRRIGNNATHNRKITSREALLGVKALFHFCQYAILTYTDDAYPKSFVESYIPADDPVKVALREIAQLKEALQKQQEITARQQELLEANTAEKAAHEALKLEFKTLKDKNKHTPIPDSDISESETRRLYIDSDLKAVGWDLSAENVVEYEVHNMPRHINPTGKGYIDYVLWGDDGLPLAIVEAKKTCVDAKKGKAQASVYADCLEKIFGRRPVLFYTNGFETWLWDDQFNIPRNVYGFYSKDQLQLMVDRRSTRKDIRTFTPDPAIAGRYYQKEAIQRITEAFVTDGADGLIGNRRKALVVMATGTGKTRTAIALVDILMKANWAKRVLFLADRNALVTQAKRNFNDLLGHLSAIDLGKESEDKTTRLVFSTYPSMLNRIDDARNSYGTIYGVGHFDLIIVDEAHRSIYKKYEDIFTYFDALMIGLTATPRGETHKDTYQAFDCEPGNPTYYYELDQAVSDGFLVPPKKISFATKFLRRGIKYNELPEEEKEEYEKAFAQWGEVPDEIDAAAINRWLFNKDTVVKVLDALMSNGHKVNSGDKIGKTIIFARTQEHAEFIEKVFNEQYPEHSGHFARTISYKDQKYAQDLIDKFKAPDRHPEIAISVDMLDTGIDVPEVVNLLLFKPVFSKSKFWQMIGRGTRLCPDLFGPGKDKEDFYVFDCFGNFEYFDVSPEGVTSGSGIKSVSHRIFELRIFLAEALRAPEYQEESFQKYRNLLLDISNEMVKELYENKDKFRIKMRLAILKKYVDRIVWNELNHGKVNEVCDQLGPLMSLKDPDEKAKLFDVLLFKMQLAYCSGDPVFEKGKKTLINKSARLANNANVPAIREKLPLLQRIQADGFWKEITLPSLEYIRMELRGLMRLLSPDTQDTVYTNFEDELGEWADPEDVLMPSAPSNYLARVKSFIRKNRDYIVIQKIITNQPITQQELNQLEDLLFDGQERGTKNDFIEATGNSRPLGLFIRSILGLDRNAALQAFSTFLEKGNLTADQQKFIEILIDHFTENGFIEPSQLYESPYTDINMGGLDGVFADGDCDNIISIIRGVNAGAGWMVG